MKFIKNDFMENKQDFNLLLKVIEDCFQCKVCNRLNHICYFCFDYLTDIVSLNSGEEITGDDYKGRYMKLASRKPIFYADNIS